MVLKPLRKHWRDALFEQRFTARYAEHLLMLLPLLTFAVTGYWHLGVVSLPAVGVAAITYLLVSGVLYYRVRRETLLALRREGVADDDYRPPY